MSDVIRLDRSKPFSECRGERAPDDPHYRVHNWQGQKVGQKMVLLPFDSNDELVPDDGKTAPYQGLVDGKPVMHHPLYTKEMRELVALKNKRHAAISTAPTEPTTDEVEAEKEAAIEEVNFVSWLRGEARYEWHLLAAAAKKRYSVVYQNKKALVEGLVLDEKVVPEDKICPELAKLLPARQAA